jgi:hypothetical protein
MLGQLLRIAKNYLRRFGMERARWAARADCFQQLRANDSEARGLKLLRGWLSPEQLAQYDAKSYFDVTGCDSGIRYRIRHGTSMNINEIDHAGHPGACWCFVPDTSLVAGDVMLAQKIALETDERSALAVANKFAPKETQRSVLLYF